MECTGWIRGRNNNVLPCARSRDSVASLRFQPLEPVPFGREFSSFLFRRVGIALIQSAEDGAAEGKRTLLLCIPPRGYLLITSRSSGLSRSIRYTRIRINARDATPASIVA